MIHSLPRLNLFATLLLMQVLLAPLCCCVAQEAKSQTEEQQSKAAASTAFVQEYSDAEVESYEFGMRIQCSGGYAKAVTGNAPIPIAWPEQEVELYEETKSNSIGKIRIKKLGKTASIMAFVVPVMRDGETSEAILRYRVKRRGTIYPDDTEQFSFAKKLSGPMKAYLKPSPFIDSREEQIVEIGKTISEKNKEESAWAQVEAIYSWVREHVRYKFDTQIHTCVEALESGHGDCEELSSLFIAICRSQGIPARAVWVPGHTYPEFYLVDETGQGHWFPCEVTGDRHEFGERTDTRPILQKGDRFRTPVSGEWKRYVEAGLRAADATGALKVEHLMRKVEK